MNNKHVKTSKETLKKCVSLANDAHGRTEEGASPCASGAGKRFNQRFPKETLKKCVFSANDAHGRAGKRFYERFPKKTPYYISFISLPYI